jgi:small-conductance mechanosensitive channel
MNGTTQQSISSLAGGQANCPTAGGLSAAEMMAQLKAQCNDRVDKAFNKCETDCVKKVYNDGMGTGTTNWGWFGMLLLWFVIFAVIIWLILYSLKPAFVLRPGTTDVDTGRVLLFSIIAALILVIIVWLIRALAYKNSK